MSRHSTHKGLEFYPAPSLSPPPSYSPPPDYSMSSRVNERVPMSSSSEMRGAEVSTSGSGPAMRVQARERGSKTSKTSKAACSFLRSTDQGQSSPPMQYTKANFDLFIHPPTTSTLTSFIHWRPLLCNTLEEFPALIVRSVSLMKCICGDFQHEYLNLEVDNTETKHTLTLLTQCDVSGKVKTGLAKDEVIILSGRDESHPRSCRIRNISWRFVEDAPKLIHVLRLLALTSSLMGPTYTAKRENCYRFAALSFQAIQLFRPGDDYAYEMEDEKKGSKQGKLYGVKVTDMGNVPMDVLTIIVQFYNGRMQYREREVGMGSATTRGDKGKSKQKAIKEEAIQEGMGQEEMRRGPKLVRRHSSC